MRVNLGRSSALFLLLLLCPLVRSQQPDPLVASADAAYAAKSYASAIEQYRQIVASQRARDVRARAASRIGYAYHSAGNKAQARLSWEAVATAFPDQPKYASDALLRAGNLAGSAGDIEGAATLYERAVADYVTVAETADTVVQAASHLGYMRLKQWERCKVGMEDPAGQAAMPAKHAAALAAFRKVIELFPKNDEWVRDSEMNALELEYQGALLSYGFTYNGVVAGCDGFLKQWVSDPKRTPVVMLIRAEALQQGGTQKDAIEAIQALRKAWPDASPQIKGTAQRLLADCYRDSGDIERAIKEYQAFLDAKMDSYIPDVDRPVAQFMIGRCLGMLGRLDEATLAYKKVVDGYPASDLAKLCESKIAAIEKTKSR